MHASWIWRAEWTVFRMDEILKLGDGLRAYDVTDGTINKVTGTHRRSAQTINGLVLVPSK